MSVCIVFCLFGALDLGLRSRLRHTSIPLGYWLRRYILTWPAGESLSFSNLNLEYSVINVNLETLAESIQLSPLESGTWHLTLWQTCLIGKAELALHSISRHPHISFLSFPEVLRKWFYLQCQKQYMLSHSRSGRLENSASFEPVIVAVYYFQLWLWAGKFFLSVFIYIL